MTNREILIKLAEGKKFRRKDNIAGELVILMNPTGFVVTEYGDSYYEVSRHDDWQEVVEPLKWETSLIMCVRHETRKMLPFSVDIPCYFEGKHVRVTVEEII